VADLGLYTYADLTGHLRDWLGGKTTGRDRNRYRIAAREAMREFVNIHEWAFYYTEGSVTTNAPYSTGTVAYGHTGGTYEYQVTLSSGTWPSWAALGKLQIGTAVYEIDERKSDTVLTLLPNSNPGEDVVSGTSYNLWRETYPLPVDFAALHSEVFDALNARVLVERPIGYALAVQRVYRSTSEPDFFTFIGDTNYMGAMGMRFSPAPSTSRRYDFIYRRRPRELKVESYSTGTVSVTNGSATVTGSGTSFTQDHVGSVFRVSSDSEVPTGYDGGNPFAFERVITSVTNSTTLTLDASADETLSGKAYAISDPVDVQPGDMLNALTTLARYRLGVMTSHQDRAMLAAEYKRELRAAMAADQKNKVARSMNQRLTLGPTEHILEYGRMGTTD